MFQNLSIETIVSLSLNGLLFVISAVSAIVAIKRKNSNAEESSEQTTLLKVAAILEKLPDYINQAEAIFPSSLYPKAGLVRLNYVLLLINKECWSNNIDFNEDSWKAEIENILTTPQKKEVQNGE